MMLLFFGDTRERAMFHNEFVGASNGIYLYDDLNIATHKFFFLLVFGFIGGYSSNGASSQSFQSDGDSANTTVRILLRVCLDIGSLTISFCLLCCPYSCLVNFHFIIDICWRP